jgi:hypothetical protein
MSDRLTSNACESLAHHQLKSLALAWAQRQGFRIVAAEVSLPNRGARIDVAAYRPARIRKERWNERLKRRQVVSAAALGATAIFECKAFRTDYRRDARSITTTLERLAVLTKKKARIEEELRIFYPSIRNGDSLFQEFETLNFERPGYERYQRVIEQLRRLSAQLHENTKFARLAQYASANLYYIVAEPDILSPHELPAGWGWLVRRGDDLELVARPVWHDVGEDQRLDFLHRIAAAGTAAVNRQLGKKKCAEGDQRSRFPPARCSTQNTA